MWSQKKPVIQLLRWGWHRLRPEPCVSSPRSLCVILPSSGNLSFRFRKFVSVFDPEAQECGRMRWARGVDISPAVESKRPHTHAHACTCTRLRVGVCSPWMSQRGRRMTNGRGSGSVTGEAQPRVVFWRTAAVSGSQQRVLGRTRADGRSAPGSRPLRT